MGAKCNFHFALGLSTTQAWVEETVMFLDELTPVVRELFGHPAAFFGGFVSGVLRLNLADDPVKSWLEKQGGVTVTPTATDTHQHNGGGPQTIAIE
jgi:hypothetical protein